jgi:hypothetical protein
MEALSRALQLQIVSVFPYIKDRTIFIDKTNLSATFNNVSSSKHIKQKVYIMWTGSISVESVDFVINHFVPLISNEEMELIGKRKQPVIIQLNESGNVSSIEKGCEISSDIKDDMDASKSSDEQRSSSDSCSSMSKSTSIEKSDSSQGSSDEKKGISEDSDDSTKTTKTPGEENQEDIAEVDKSHASTASGSTIMTLQSDVWLSMAKLITFPKTRKILDKVPIGKKGCKAFLIKNERNYGIFKAKFRQKEKSRKKMTYCDDKAAYKRPSQNYILHALKPDELVSLRNVKLEENGICTLKGIPIAVQPDENELFYSKRTYHHTKDDSSNFAKRTTEFMITPPSYKDLEGLAVVEYMGEDPKGALHGNALKVHIFLIYLFEVYRHRQA